MAYNCTLSILIELALIVLENWRFPINIWWLVQRHLQFNKSKNISKYLIIEAQSPRETSRRQFYVITRNLKEKNVKTVEWRPKQIWPKIEHRRKHL